MNKKMLIDKKIVLGRLFRLYDGGGDYCDIYFGKDCIDTINTWDYQRNERDMTLAEIRKEFANWCEESAPDYIDNYNL